MALLAFGYAEHGACCATPHPQPFVFALDTPHRAPVIRVGGGGWCGSWALTQDGSLVSWSLPSNGIDVDTTTTTTPTPHNDTFPVLLATHVWRCPNQVVHRVSGGWVHTVLCTIDGLCFSWGVGSDGQLGHGDTRSVSTPKQITSLPADIMDVAAGFNASLAITRTGSLLSWGSGPLLGRRDDPCVVHSLPRLVEGLEGRKITHAVCGGSHALLLGEGGCVLSYGWGLYGQLGDGLCTSQAIPKEITSLQGEVWTSLSAGPWHSAAVNDEGDIVTWGRGDAGQLGHGDTQSRPEPHLVETMQGKKVKVVACGSRHTVMLTEEGEVFASGWNRYGQLGSGDTTDTLTPRRMATRARAIGCGCWHSLVALDQGDVT